MKRTRGLEKEKTKRGREKEKTKRGREKEKKDQIRPARRQGARGYRQTGGKECDGIRF